MHNKMPFHSLCSTTEWPYLKRYMIKSMQRYRETKTPHVAGRDIVMVPQNIKGRITYDIATSPIDRYLRELKTCSSTGH
jgi:hypothetical protein